MMTKDELLKEYGDPAFFRRDSVVVPMEALNKFFESNVCIPKGANRHPYADVLHEWLEGAETEYRNALGRIDRWGKLSFQLSEYRIKPKEPIYEWQFVKSKGYTEIARSSFFTDNEAKEFLTSYWEKDEKTKRERKQ